MNEWQEEETSLEQTDAVDKKEGNISSSSSASPAPQPTTYYATSLLILSIALIHSDQNLLAPNLTAASIDLNITDPTERDAKLGGGLAFGLFLVGAPAALVIGAKSDGLLSGRGASGGSRRSDLLSTVLLIGSIGCIGSALSQNFPQIFIARAITGVSLAGGWPLAMSIVGDMYGPDRRTVVTAWLGVAIHIGTMCGQFLSGWIGPTWGWRAPFFVVAIFMFCTAFVVKKTLPEPARATAADDYGRDTVASTPSTEERIGGFFSKLCEVAKRWMKLRHIRTFWLVMLQGIPGCVPWGVIATFLPDYLHVDAGLSVRQATFTMTTFQVGGILGTCFSGEVGQRLYNISHRLPAAYMFVVGNIGIIPMWYLITSTTATTSMFQCSIIATLGGFFASQTGPNVRATLANVTNSSQRGLAFASFILFDDVGKGAGPVFIAALISTFGRRAAFATSMLFWAPCALLNGLTAWTVLNDEKAALSSRVKTDDDGEVVEEEIEMQSHHNIV